MAKTEVAAVEVVSATTLIPIATTTPRGTQIFPAVLTIVTCTPPSLPQANFTASLPPANTGAALPWHFDIVASHHFTPDVSVSLLALNRTPAPTKCSMAMSSLSSTHPIYVSKIRLPWRPFFEVLLECHVCLS
ncbi:hypothetical protein V2J09_003770 [Rumex salicifolius]